MIRLAASTGVSPLNARFTAVSDDDVPAPGGAFLALELPFKGAKSKVTLDHGRVLMSADTSKPILDVTGLDKVGFVEVVKVGADTGVIYRSAGVEPPASEINSADPGGRSAMVEEGSPWLRSRSYWWMLPILAIVFMIALLVFASRMRRRKASERGSL